MKKIIFASLIAIVFGVSLNATVYATVNGKDITDQDLKVLLRSMPGATYEQLPPTTQKKVVEQAVERELLAQHAVKSGIEKEADFQKALSKIKSDLALELWMKKEFAQVKVDEKSIKDYYNKNESKFVKPSRAKARHILLKTEKEAVAVINELKNLKGDALNKKFIELAKTKSVGPSAKEGGELGWFDKGRMVKAFSDAAFALKKGAITMKPVKTQFGYHVILLENKEVGKKATLAEMKPKIEYALKMEKFRKKVSDEAKSLKKGAKITIK
ncbi:peptidylprolyl isomerase [Sulfurospirillum sp. 1612]|uniref:peptidylprolyl isomerase n=1 Tax=Sulfurospirillum sp. 1612 TaxID=3094835 RepID=UPI002F92E49D